MSVIIEAVELSRWYGIVMGLNNVSFQIEDGITGLVGPNGAGKSTLVQIITGQLRPNAGVLTVFGEEPWNNPRLLRRMGYCPEKESLHDEFRPVDWLTALGMMSGMTGRQAKARAEEMLTRVKLPTAAWGRRLGKYSKGMRQRVKLAQALMHEPDLIVLDEPMNGLDPMGRQEMTTILKSLANDGTHILISSHILQELETLSKSVLILNWGRVLASGRQMEIRSDLKDWSEQATIRCGDPERLARTLFDADVLAGFRLAPSGDEVTIQVKDAAAFYERSADLLLESGVEVFEVRSESRSLNNIFEKVTE